MAVNRLVQFHSTLKHRRASPLVLSNCRVFFDFDNTLTVTDVLMEIIKKFSVNDHWKALEKSWVNGEIGTKECLAGQLQGIRVTKETFVLAEEVSVTLGATGGMESISKASLSSESSFPSASVTMSLSFAPLRFTEGTFQEIEV